MATGLCGLFVAQVWAFLLIAPESEHVSAKDLILSARLWSMTCRRLPQTQRQVWLGGWSMATILSAIFLIGGFSYWYQYYHPKKIADKGLIQAIANAYRDYTKQSLEDAQSFAEKLTAARSLDKAVEAQTEFARQACETFADNSRKIRELHRELFWQAFRLPSWPGGRRTG